MPLPLPLPLPPPPPPTKCNYCIVVPTTPPDWPHPILARARKDKKPTIICPRKAILPISQEKRTTSGETERGRGGESEAVGESFLLGSLPAMKYTLKNSEISHQFSSSPKPLSSSNNNSASAHHQSPTYSDTFNLCYEPTSVLDIRGSPVPPSSTAGIPPPLSDVLPDDLPLQWDESSDDWDQLLTGLGVPLSIDTSPGSRVSTFPQLGLGVSDPQLLLSPLPEFSPASTATHFADCGVTPFPPSDLIASLSDQNDLSALDLSNNTGIAPWVAGPDSVDELIRAAECVDSNELQLALGILARLNPRLQSPQGKPIQRAAFYFKEGLTSLLLATGSNRRPRSSSSSEIVQTIRAYKAFSSISPIPMFSHFTANQVLLEAVDGSPIIHVIDFDIGLGGKWASFMREIAERSQICRVNPPVLRISAVVPEEFVPESRLIGDSLSQFAREFRLGFHIEFVLTRSFDALSFNAVKFIDGEMTTVHLSPATFARLGAINGVPGFLSDLRRLSPRVVVLVDGDGWIDAGPPSFRQNFITGLKFYSTMLESLDATSGGNDWVRRIETFLVRPKIFAAVRAVAGGGRRAAPWKELLVGAGLGAVQLSQFAVFQAEYLLGKSQVKGFHVAKRHGEMVLCWHDRPLVATSAWRCC